MRDAVVYLVQHDAEGAVFASFDEIARDRQLAHLRAEYGGAVWGDAIRMGDDGMVRTLLDARASA